MEPHHHHEHSHRLTSLNKAFIIGIALNITFVIVEFGVGCSQSGTCHVGLPVGESSP